MERTARRTTRKGDGTARKGGDGWWCCAGDGGRVAHGRGADPERVPGAPEFSHRPQMATVRIRIFTLLRFVIHVSLGR